LEFSFVQSISFFDVELVPVFFYHKFEKVFFHQKISLPGIISLKIVPSCASVWCNTSLLDHLVGEELYPLEALKHSFL
jgi:hypothetical protein